VRQPETLPTVVTPEYPDSMTIHLSLFLLISPWVSSLSSEEPTHVGSQACISCHGQEHAAWQSSHHSQAMLLPGEAGAVASFKGEEVNAGGLLSRFIEISGVPHVEVEDGSGKIQKPVKYFFGIEPCQQVLIEDEPGRLQSYPIAWSTGTGEKAEGWYPLFPGEKTPAGDPLHWSGSLNNWNHMCAECHSTGVTKNFDAATQRFDTRYEEIDVACEACHGPGSRHVQWAESVRGLSKQDEMPPPPDHFGFGMTLSSGQRQWTRAEGEKVATRNPALPHHLEQETCARCHSRRTALVDGSLPGEPLSQTHRLSLLEEGLYYPDGQILDEVYVHGSFLQSRMHQKGVTCTDCHDPHSGDLYLEGNALCIGCHEPARYDTVSHTHHAVGTPGSQCIDCHMTSRVYMGTDRRHDHSFRIPRPDLTEGIGTPNACNDCHSDETANWADLKIREWFPNGVSGRFHWGQALHAVRSNQKNAPILLGLALDDEQLPAIVRGTLLSEYSRLRQEPDFRNREDLQRIVGNLTAPDPLVRRGALLGLQMESPYDLGSWILQFLEDPDRSVRLTAAQYLAEVILQWPESTESPKPPILDRALLEYRRSQEIHSDRAEALVNLAQLAETAGDLDQAESIYRKALKREPHFCPASVNLSDLLARAGKLQEAITLLDRAISRVGDDSGLHHARGLLLIRSDRREEGFQAIEKAYTLSPESLRYAYVYAIALHDFGNTSEAIRTLRKTLKKWPNSSAIRRILAEYQQIDEN
jgi:predicted CXXCH cytochrome family protein